MGRLLEFCPLLPFLAGPIEVYEANGELSLNLSKEGFNTAHASNEVVRIMKMRTTVSSLRESRSVRSQ